MIYELRHLTTYKYGRSVPFARCVLRVSPRADVEQTVTGRRLVITPKPTQLHETIGPFGETVVSATIATPHNELKILVTSKVEVNRPALKQLFGGPAWETVREQGFASRSLDLASPAHFLYPTPMTASHRAITAYAAQFMTPGRPVLEAAFAMARQIRADFTYDPASTEVSTPVIEAFEARHGVCQDFAHIMISGLRGLGLPAAYVSGYLRTIPAPGKPRLEGADATHAWVNVWCGETLGWIGLDPTNALVVASDHIVLAVGRDYSDVAPIGGVVLGAGSQDITVGVDVIPLGQDREIKALG